MPEDNTVRPGRQPWSGKVHNPIKLFDVQMAEKNSQRSGEFAKGQTAAILKRFSEIEAGITTLATAIKERFEKMETELAELKVARATGKRVAKADAEDEG